MSYENLTKGLVMVGAVYMVTSFFVFHYETSTGETVERINSMSNNLNDADKPSEAFRSLTDDINTSNTYLQGEMNVLGEKVEGESFTARMKLAGKAMYDTSHTFSIFFDNVPEETDEELRTEGLYLESCPDSYSYGYLCNQIRPPKLVNYWANWMANAQEVGSVEEVRRNTTAWNKVRDYLKRAEYYDKRLAEFQMRPLQVVYYTDTGLYVVGRGEERIEVDGETYMLQGEDPLNYVDIELDNGSHILKRGNHRILLEVGPDIPNYGINQDQKLAVDNDTGPYTAVKLKGEATIMEQLNTQNTTVVDIPADKDQNWYEPFRVTFISPGYNQTITLGESYPTMTGRMVYYYGMEPEEYRKTQEILNKTDVRQEIPVY